MVVSRVLEVLRLISNDPYVRLSAFIILALSLLSGFILGYFSGVLLFSSYVLGYVACHFSIKHQMQVEQWLSKWVKKPTAIPKLKASCSVCDDLTCRRHSLGKSVAPWKDIKVTAELNAALVQFYDRILELFVSSWYSQFTGSNEFMNELRFSLKYASATLVNRFLETDYITVITDQLVPQAIKHIDDYLYMQQIAQLKKIKFDEVIVEYMGSNLHPATTNRRNELEYLRLLSTELIKHLLPQSCISCKNYTVLLRELLSGWVLLPLMDVISDPNIINSLVIVAVNYKSTKTPRTDQSEEVELLYNFFQPDENPTQSAFAFSLNKIKNTPELLYALMQFLKKEAQVHLLQFCLDVDDFNTRLLTPDLSKKQLEELLVQAITLHSEYLSVDAANFIGCPPAICTEFSELISDIYSVAKLRTSKPLYQAYDFAFNQLENVWLPQFFHSNEFYNSICGPKVTSGYSKPTAKSSNFGSPSKLRSKKSSEQSSLGAVSKISSGLGKIKGVLKPAIPVEGSLDAGYLDKDKEVQTPRDLSRWKVDITRYEVSTSSKVVYFCLNVVHAEDTCAESRVNRWTVWRKDQDFFTLKTKLVEFHGEREICDSPLPSRKAGTSVETRKCKYQEFITRLLRKPSLKGSDLLHTFLTNEGDFTLVIATAASTNQDIGNIYQSVAYKLRKEKGQNLDSFINTFITSVTNPKQENLNLTEEGVEAEVTLSEVSALPKTYTNDVFNDNFGVSYKLDSLNSSNNFSFTLFSDGLFYLFRHVFKINLVILKLYVAICSVIQQLVDHLAKLLIEKKIKSGLTQHNLAYLIGLLEGVIFNQRTPSTPEDYQDRRKRAFTDIQFCPQYLNAILGGEVNNGLVTLLEILQNPHYNKQLTYNLLDTVLTELFPELKDTVGS